MKPPYFGTDGIRDAVDGPLLAENFVRRLGYAYGNHIRESSPNKPLHVVIGRDTRASGSALSTWLTEGLDAAGVKVFDGGIVPTPAVALAVRQLDLDGGLVVTASHNPATDNGIKLFGPGGLKLTTAEEAIIEKRLEETPDLPRPARPPASFGLDARRHYKQFVTGILPPNALVGWTICVDAANGATAYTSPEILEALGARVIRLGALPDGHNINANCGSEYPAILAETVRTHGANIGIAHDGDGDRLIVIDETGATVDGDCLIGLLAQHLHVEGRLPGDTVVTTVMSNAGLAAFLEKQNLRLERTPVGDRNVLHRLLEGGFQLGGENSGHLIVTDRLPAGDGCIGALELLACLLRRGEPLSQARKAITLFPQKLINLRVREKVPLEGHAGLQNELVALETNLGKSGRILLRYSGTEPKIRLLVEASTPELVDQTLDELQKTVARHLPLL
ncbi:MAG: phosphoglucosamine mutase [Opitutales bacterium]|nr:phosphoglucosamine mutase [Opitutales bacterium]